MTNDRKANIKNTISFMIIFRNIQEFNHFQSRPFEKDSNQNYYQKT